MDREDIEEAAARSLVSPKKSKLSIKIKIPADHRGSRSRNAEGEEEEEEEFIAQDDAYAVSGSVGDDGTCYKYVCSVCGRGFHSGKSWGGHKRHHLKIKKDSLRLKKAQNPKPKINITFKQPTSKVKCVTATVDGGIPICSLCGKEFRSMNSLFGHMRFHPDRSWRGMHPPASSTIKSRSDASEAVGSPGKQMKSVSGVDLMASLKSGWSKTDKRGRICLSNYSVPQAAHNLIKLSRDTFVKRNTEETLRECRSKSSAKKLKFDGIDDARNKLPPIKEEGGSTWVDDKDDEGRSGGHKNVRKLKGKLKVDDNCEGKVDNEFKICRRARMKKTDIKMKAEPGLHGCGTVKESSPTETTNRSAFLGNDKSTVAILDSSVVVSALEVDELKEDESPLSVKSLFTCDTCCQTFPTDEALEGHKRCHLNALSKPPSPSNEEPSTEEVNHPIHDRAESSAEATDQERVGEQASNRMLGIDLNMPYDMQEAE